MAGRVCASGKCTIRARHMKGIVNSAHYQAPGPGSRSTGWVHALTGTSKASSSSSLPPPAAIVMGRSTNPLCSTCGMQAKGQGEGRGAAAAEAKLFHSLYNSSTPLPEDED